MFTEDALPGCGQREMRDVLDFWSITITAITNVASHDGLSPARGRSLFVSLELKGKGPFYLSTHRFDEI